MIEENDKNLYSIENEVNNSSVFSSVEIQKAGTFSKSYSQIKVTNKNMYYEQKLRKRKKNHIIGLFFIIIGLVSIVSGLLMNSNDVFNSKKGKRTIMIYMIGSDLESKYLAATKDINEMIDIDVDLNDNNIIIYTGGSKIWYTENIDSNKHTLLEINKNGIDIIQEFDNNNMLNYKNLSYLLNYGYNNYSTEYYDLILWDHGAGPIYGYGYDEYNKYNSMTITDIKKALLESPFNTEKKLEFIGFDACLMSSIEIAKTLSSFSDYMIASQEFEPGEGWDYSFLEKVNSKTTSLELGKMIIDYFDNYYNTKNYSKGYSLSLLKLNRIDNVVKNTDILFEKMDENIDIDFSSISRTRSESKSFGRIKNDEYYYDLVDFSDLLDKLPNKYNKEISSLKGSLSDLIIYQKTDLENTYGVSLYFPYENKNDLSSNIIKYKNLNYSNQYNNFLDKYLSTLNGEKKSSWNLENSSLYLNNNELSITLPQEIIDNYSSAEYIIFEKKGNDFLPIFSGSDLTVDNGRLSTKIEKKSITTKYNDELFTVTAIESVNGINYKSYLIPGTVTKVNNDDFSIDVLGVYIEFVVDENNPNGYISAVYPIELNENLTYSKVKVDLSKWDSLTLLNYKYKILNDEGVYTNNWISSEMVDTFNIDDISSLIVEFNDIDISKEYYCLFKIKDSQGFTYYTNLIDMK